MLVPIRDILLPTTALASGTHSRGGAPLTRADRAWWLALAAALCLIVMPACQGQQAKPSAGPWPAPAPVADPAQPPSYFLYAPPTLPAEGPLQLVVALHGMGDDGPNLAKSFMPLAREHGWLLAAPTMAYGDWFDPVRVRADDLAFGRQLEALLADVPLRIGREVPSSVFLVGFSRGAQLADRFAFFHPDEVAGVASMSAGTYTMPEDAADLNGDGVLDPLPLPFGTADMQRLFGHSLDVDQLRRVPFWVSVGSNDDNPNDLPRQWDSLLGRTRVTRARAFASQLQTLRVPVQLQIFPDATHQLTAPMAAGADAFFSRL